MIDFRFIDRWRRQANQLKIEIYILYLAYKDPRVPWYAKVFLACIVGYAFSPIDLIPDFIPVLGYCDDVVLLPLGIALALKMIPEEVLEECKERAHSSFSQNKPKSLIATSIIIAIWLLVIVMFMTLIFKKVNAV